MTPYVLADDLSGALETGAAFRANGWRAMLPLHSPSVPEGVLRIVSTETRNRSAADAERIAREVLEREKAAGAELLFKKIDSTLRGPIGAELKAVLDVLQPTRVLLCPANPIAGRTIRDGVIRVHGVPLMGTDFRHDPYWPAKSSSVTDILTSQGVTSLARLSLKDVRRGAEGTASAMRAAYEGGVRIVIVDAELQRDLGVIAQAGRAAGADFFIGSGGFADAIAASTRPASVVPPPPVPTRFESMVVIAGSRSTTTERQLKALEKTRKIKGLDVSPADCDSAKITRLVQEELSARQVAVVRFGAPLRTPVDPVDLIACVGKTAEAFAAQLSPHIYFLTGGETAWTVCRALSGTSLEILGEAEPGVVFACLERSGAPAQFVITKPGGFGREDLLVRLASAVK